MVDHINPHRGDKRKFYDKHNLQSMAKSCHDSMKQSQEKGGIGFLKGCDEYGNPILRDHDWYS